jgi:opacity protein-like surface antigen
MYDSGDGFIIAEWMEQETSSRSQAGYLSAGMRLDRLTPYILVSAGGKGTFTTGMQPTAAALRAANRSQSTLGVGVCWDVMKNTAFKLEYDRVTLGKTSNGYLANVPGNVNLAGSSFHVVTGVVDFVF